jgi:ribonuclease BN (tRNA processing enzyme)
VRVIPLGVGGAFTDKFYHTNYIVEIPGFRLLIDAGTTLRYSLSAAGYTAKDIDAVAITHFHSDHVGGLEEFAQRCKFMYKHRPTVYAMPDQIPLLTSLFALHGAKPEDYLKLSVSDSTIILKSSNDVQYQLEYYSTVGLHAGVTSNYMIGIRWVARDKPRRIVFTGDIGTIEKSALGRLVGDSETAAVFHDCHTGAAPTFAHPTMEQIINFYPAEQLKKIYCIHYGDNIADCAEQIKAVGLKIAMQGESIDFYALFNRHV